VGLSLKIGKERWIIAPHPGEISGRPAKIVSGSAPDTEVECQTPDDKWKACREYLGSTAKCYPYDAHRAKNAMVIVGAGEACTQSRQGCRSTVISYTV